MSTLLAVADTPRTAESSVHLTSDRVASFLDGRLTDVERESAIRHLAECDQCRSEMSELRAMIPSAPASISRRWMLAGAALAAALAFLVVPRFSTTAGDSDGTSATRSTGGLPDGASAIVVVTPNDQDALPAAGITLTWRSVAANATYRLTIQDSTGGVVWTRPLTDTSLALPDSAGLKRGSTYFWSVDAQLANGQTATTGARTFTVR